MAIDIQEARRLLAEASPAPWEQTVAGEIFDRDIEDDPIVQAHVHGPTLADRKCIVFLRNHAAEMLDEIEAKGKALTKISAIRDSIVGMQGFNWSEHAYPLTAALDEAGYHGVGYDIARKSLGTLIEQAKEADRQRDEALAASAAKDARIAELEKELAAISAVQVDAAERGVLAKAFFEKLDAIGAAIEDDMPPPFDNEDRALLGLPAIGECAASLYDRASGVTYCCKLAEGHPHVHVDGGAQWTSGGASEAETLPGTEGAGT